MSNHFGIARTFFLCGLVDFVCLGLFLVYAGSQFQPQETQLSGHRGSSLLIKEKQQRKRIENNKNKNQPKLMAKGSKLTAAKVLIKEKKKNNKEVVGKGGVEGGLGSIFPTMAMAAVKISLMFSPIAVAWAMFYSPV